MTEGEWEASFQARTRLEGLSAMGDEEVVHKILGECTDYADRAYPDRALWMLREAGFVRRGELDLERAELKSADATIEHQGEILTGVVNALRGPPPEGTQWSHHDAASLAMAERARTRAAEDALLDLTPQGSEFFRRNPDRSAEREFIVDVPACVAYVRGRLDRMRESVVAARREVRKLRWPEGGRNPIEDEMPVASITNAELPAVGSFHG